MQLKLIIFTTLLAIGLALTGCGGGSGNTGNTPNVNAGNANAPVSNLNANLEPTKKVDAPKTNDAPTLKPVVVAYYDALKKKDDGALRKVLSAELIKELETDMKSEKKTNLAAYVAETDKIPENGIEVRNEKINGQKAVAEVKGGTYINWTPLAFVQEGGVWKMSNENPDIDAVTKSASK